MCHLAIPVEPGETEESLAAECGTGHHADTEDGCPEDLPPANRCACPLPVVSLAHPELDRTCSNLVLVAGELCEVCETICKPWINRG